MIFLYRIRKSLSTKLSVGILVLVVIGFSMALGFLFQHSRSIVMQEAIERADRILKNNALRVTGFLDEVETATHNMEWLILENQQPDSLLNFTHRMVELNRHFNGCSITMEPNTFPQYGRYFSAYSVRKGDSISTVREAEYEYFEKVWYKLPKSQGKAVWTDPYDDFNAGTLYSDEIIASYCVPLYTSDHHFVGVISTDMSLPWLSATITHERPYKNSYCIMIGKSGQYYVHPDSTKLINQTIFSGIEPDLHPDIITLGHQMTTGKKGYLRVNIDGKDCYVFYQPVPKTDWSIALVCSAYDVFHAYNRFAYIVVPLLIIGLVMISLVLQEDYFPTYQTTETVGATGSPYHRRTFRGPHAVQQTHRHYRSTAEQLRINAE
jgi:Cache domain.